MVLLPPHAKLNQSFMSMPHLLSLKNTACPYSPMQSESCLPAFHIELKSSLCKEASLDLANT